MAFALTACGGGEGSAEQTPVATPTPAPTPIPAPAPAATPKSILIEAYGDSTMWGSEGNNPAYQVPLPMPAVAEHELQAEYGAAVTVNNEGIPGTTADSIMNGTDGKHLPWVQLMANSKAQIVLANYGINDASRYHNESATAYGLNLAQMVDAARASGKIMVLVEPNAICDKVDRPKFPDYVAQMRSVAAAKNVPLVPNYDLVNAATPDCLHPLAPQYAEMGVRLAKALAPFVATLLK